MTNLYDALIAILRDHWKTHDNAYPQRIELSASDMQALLEVRQLVNHNMNFKPQDGWETHLQGVPLQLGDVTCVVDVHGVPIPVLLGSAEAPADS